MYSEYTSKNETYRDSLWEPVGEASGTVAVPKIWATEKGLPLGRDVPWNDSQTLYAINAYHSLHCIVSQFQSYLDQLAGNSVTVLEIYICFVEELSPFSASGGPGTSCIPLLGSASRRCYLCCRRYSTHWTLDSTPKVSKL